MKYIVDVQGFTSVKDFIFKELAFVLVEEDVEPTVFLFKPPYPWPFFSNKSPNAWVEKNHHGLLWESGDIPYEEMEKILQSIFHEDDDIFVKGLEKTVWLEKLLPKRCIYNIEDLGCPALKKLVAEGVSCSNHISYLNASCAKKNVKAVQYWLMEQRRKKLEELLHLIVL